MHWQPRRVVLLFASLVATGCARYHPVGLSPAESLETLEARRLDAPALGEFLRAGRAASGWPPPFWDLRLMTLAAFFYSPALDVARAQWAVARGGMLTAGGRQNPSVTAGIGYNASTPTDQITPWISDLALDLPIEIAGKRGIRIDRARQLSEAARQNLLTAAWQVRSQVRRAFLDLYLARTSDSLLTLRQALTTDVVRILEAQRAVGEVSAYEVTQARLALADSRLAVLRAAERRARGRSALAEAVGVAPAAIDSLTLGFDALERITPEIPTAEIRRRALVNRSDVRGALAEYEASQAELKLEIRKQYPDLNIGPGYQLDQGDSKWTLSLSLPVGLFNRNRGPIAEARARREEVAARFLVLQSRVLAEIEGAAAAARAVVVHVGIADSLMTGLGRQERAARASYQAGETSKLQWLGVQIELVATALSRLDAVAQAQQTLGALEDAIQSPLDIEQWTIEAPLRTKERNR